MLDLDFLVAAPLMPPIERLSAFAIESLAFLLAATSERVAKRLVVLPLTTLPKVLNRLGGFFAILDALAPAIITPHCLIQDKYQYR